MDISAVIVTDTIRLVLSEYKSSLQKDGWCPLPGFFFARRGRRRPRL
jgi:hypothetical protein